uniref:DnaJ homolog subfamily C member 9 n=1 Tax=Sarcophilus harrisii TaxID=9305 RepID=A0A7N4NUE5_SARHA
MGLLERCKEEFGTTDLYEVLGVRRKASQGEIRRSYHKVSLRVHPDRVDEAGRKKATRQFQILGQVYAILSDAERRDLYDEQGLVDEEGEGPDRDWLSYWRLLFRKITLDDIKSFEEKYVGSEEELVDIKQAYVDFKGDMDQIMESLLCAEHTSEPRIRAIIQQAIDSEEVPPFKAFLKESKQKMNARKRRVCMYLNSYLLGGGGGGGGGGGKSSYSEKKVGIVQQFDSGWTGHGFEVSKGGGGEVKPGCGRAPMLSNMRLRKAFSED